MLVIGKTDAFEQNYMAKFEQLATDHGVFVKYESDRAARDIGLHLTKDLKSGKKQVTNSLIWFQMKGVMATTLTLEAFKAAKSVSLSMDVEHLRHWFLDGEPTHLIVYVESAEQFLVMNLQNYVAKTWGHRILTLDQKTATVTVPATSVLDDQAFAILLRYADVAQWVKALNAEQADIQIVRRDFNLIYALGTAESRGVEYGIQWVKWLSKMRHELRVRERSVDFNGNVDSGWETIHEHWQFGGIDPEDSYPYLELFALVDYESDDFMSYWDEEESFDDGETITLKNGDKVFGPNASNEYCDFAFGARLNEYGQKLFGYVETLVKIGLLELRDSETEGRTFLSIAPWHDRLV
ncbi:hypothetical protein J3D48_005707 [Pseudomonas fluorescens]|uniref:DUF4365 domain-containing protein n=1 Tax=Pseudomonas fluorescens TaxID=294 RepID=UPI0020A22DD9|nr:DUF4365 domain-containing protein [Pseudomonas fluorescens]MCP1489394.1 hypothetical protein [Pseudomonas fluorescens]